MTSPATQEQATLAGCIAHIAGVSADDVPHDPGERHAWLGELGLGLVPVADAGAFSWAGPWIALRPARDGSGPCAAVMFGVPSGVIWEPVPTAEHARHVVEIIEAGYRAAQTGQTQDLTTTF